MYCWKCGDHNPDDYRFCGACGQPRDADGPQSVNVRKAAKLPDHIADLLENFGASDVADKTFLSSSQISHQFTMSNRDGQQTIVYTDTHGRRREFTSADQMPADVREAFESVLQRNPLRNHGGGARIPRPVFDVTTHDVPQRFRRHRRGFGILKFIVGLFFLFVLWRMCT